MLPALVCCTDL